MFGNLTRGPNIKFDPIAMYLIVQISLLRPTYVVVVVFFLHISFEGLDSSVWETVLSTLVLCTIVHFECSRKILDMYIWTYLLGCVYKYIYTINGFRCTGVHMLLARYSIYFTFILDAQLYIFVCSCEWNIKCTWKWALMLGKIHQKLRKNQLIFAGKPRKFWENQENVGKKVYLYKKVNCGKIYLGWLWPLTYFAFSLSPL